MRDSGKQGRPDGAQPLIKNTLKSGKDLSQRERTAITTRIARMLALDLQPYSCVENLGFKELMNHMEPLYKIPSRTTFYGTIIPEFYRDAVMAVKERMHVDFQEGVESISLTSDMWTSRSNHSYISLTCHYLTSNFEMRSFALENRSLTESHTACNILEHLQAMMDNWELPLQKVPVCVVTDNARNFCAALRGISCVPMQCMGHTLQLAIKDAKEETAGVFAILKKCLTMLKEAICLELATSETTVPNLAPQEAHKERVSSIWDSIEKLATSSERRRSTETASIEELKRYLREPTCSKDQDPLALWKETGKQHFPGLCKMAMKYMGIPATSVPSEKLFSTAGNIVTARREKLTSDHLGTLSSLNASRSVSHHSIDSMKNSHSMTPHNISFQSTTSAKGSLSTASA
ncbi:hypothetical protein HPB52_001229 [Rhipicephalus sanguineus]|uniref:HAT C-terminal dimerisation domain-containing protein n=1 Tax=Rhipicephalus sanguineus TaxID=34632 RepID=A0A9D4Q461_RHISA|nr:hypothetical protein HPB52_001229 [Rhipicephalus sanguineus]